MCVCLHVISCCKTDFHLGSWDACQYLWFVVSMAMCWPDGHSGWTQTDYLSLAVNPLRPLTEHRFSELEDKQWVNTSHIWILTRATQCCSVGLCVCVWQGEKNTYTHTHQDPHRVPLAYLKISGSFSPPTFTLNSYEMAPVKFDYMLTAYTTRCEWD